MKLVMKIYRDSKGVEWVVERRSLPKKRGEWKYWTAESGSRSFRADTQKELFKKIEENNNERK